MRIARRFVARLKEMLGQRGLERELDDELRMHHDLLAREYERRGVPAAEAQRRAAMTLGGFDQAKERVRDVRGFATFESFLNDIRYSVRLLLRAPAFTAVAILTLALGIGTTTAVFTIVNGVLLRPLPYRDPSRLVILFYGHQGRVSPWFSPLNVRDYVGPSEAFADASAVVPITVNMTGLGDPERLQGARVSWNYFNLLGVPMALGRSFAEGDAQGDGNRIVLSDGLWRRRFGGSSGRRRARRRRSMARP